GDQVEELAGNYFLVHGRTDDTMNLSGVKVSSAEIERTLHGNPEISETAAIGFIPPDRTGTQLVIYAVPSNGKLLDKEKLKKDFQFELKTKLNPIYKIHDVVLTNSLPRTASNKVMRRLLRDEYQKSYN
ncbi:MAG TPA: AMP-dependent synthetase, partial [archaeon]|nr:AMP-dependent synthetase [archaeon]